MRLFLCLPAARLVELGLSSLHALQGLAQEVVTKLCSDLDCVQQLLETFEFDELNERLAAVQWLLLAILPSRPPISEQAVEQLVRAKVMLCPRGREDLLMRVPWTSINIINLNT